MQILAQQVDGSIWSSLFFLGGSALIAVAVVAGLSFYFWRRTRQRQRQFRQRFKELRALSEAGRAILAAQLDLTALCHLVAEQASLIIDTRTFQIGLFRDKQYDIVYWNLNGQSQPTQTFDLRQEDGLVGWVGRTRQPLLIRDFEQEIDSLPARPVYVSTNPPRSALFIPLFSGNQSLGVMAAHSRQPNHYSQDDLRRLTILANQAAAAIANGRLFDQERTRAAQLELVGQIAQQVNAIQDIDELFGQIVQLTQETFGFYSVNIFTVDGETNDAILQASSMADMTLLEAVLPGMRLPAGMGLIGSAIIGQKTIVSNHTPDDTRFIASVHHTDQHLAHIQAEIVIPLIVDNTLLGVLDVQSEKSHVFHLQDQTVLEALAAQAAIAIHKARQWARQRQQAWITTVQLQIADALNRSADLEELTEMVTRLTHLLLGVEQCSVLLWDEELNEYRGSASYSSAGNGADFQQQRFPIGLCASLDVAHIGQEPLVTQNPLPWHTLADHNYALYPLVVRSRVVGVMSVSYVDGAGLDGPGREELLPNIATQIAQAISSEQADIAQQEEAWVNTALLQVAEAINNLIELDEILNTIVRFVPMLVGVKSCVILVWDEANHSFHAGPSYGVSEMGLGLISSFAIDAREFPSMVTKTEELGPAGKLYTFQPPQWLSDTLAITTAQALPLYARGSLVGCLLVGESVNDRPLIGRRLNILTGISQQAAIALVNDQLYKISAERNRLEQELDVARTIQASFIPDGSPAIPGCTVASLWQAARQVSGDFYDFLELPDGNWGIVVADVADKGVPAALFMALSRTVLRTIAMNRLDPAGVLQTTNEIICHDTTSDLFVTIFYAIWNPTTRTLTYSSAGHNPAILLRQNGQTEQLNTRGIALGVIENITLQQTQTTLYPGDTLIIYTDGITEAINEDYDEFGLERLTLASANAPVPSTQAVANGLTIADSITNSIIETLQDHTGNTTPFDDLTLVVMNITE